MFLVLTDFVVPKYDSGSEDETDFPGPEHAGNMTAVRGRISVSSSDPVSYFPRPKKSTNMSALRTYGWRTTWKSDKKGMKNRIVE